MHALKSIEASIFNKAKILVSRQKEELAQGHQDLMDRLDELIKQAKKNKRMIIDLQKGDTEQFSKDYKGLVKKTKKINDEAQNAYLQELQEKKDLEARHELSISAKNKHYKKRWNSPMRQSMQSDQELRNNNNKRSRDGCSQSYLRKDSRLMVEHHKFCPFRRIRALERQKLSHRRRVNTLSVRMNPPDRVYRRGNSPTSPNYEDISDAEISE